MHVKRLSDPGVVHETIDYDEVADFEGWRHVQTKCGHPIKHHPIKRNRAVKEPVNCLGCLAG